MRFAIVLLIILAWPAAAWAGTARVTTDTLSLPHGATELIAQAGYTGAPGERNAVRITGDAHAIRIEDTGAAPIPGPGCVADGPSAVVCTPPAQAPSLLSVTADGGDGDDTLTAAGVAIATELDGGSGNDVLIVASGPSAFPVLDGGPGDDVLTGGEGRDTLIGGPGADVMSAGAGDDRLVADADGDDGPPAAGGDDAGAARGDDARVAGGDDARVAGGDGGPSPDRMDGGAGRDTVSYSGRTRPVHVDLASRGPAGEAGEGDTLTGIENVEGGAGADVLAGDDGPNELVGGPVGSRAGDRLIGRGGHDWLQGGSGADTLLGGAGADLLEGFGGADRYDGGPGADRYSLDDYGRRGTADVHCSSALDVVDLDDSAPPLIHSDCPRVIAHGVSLRLRGRTVAVRAYGREYQRVCRVRLRFGTASVIVRVTHAHDHVAPLPPGHGTDVTAGFAACGEGFRYPVRFRIAPARRS